MASLISNGIIMTNIPSVVVSKDAPPPPSAQDITALTAKAFNASTSNASVEACYGLCEVLLSSVGSKGLEIYGVIDEIQKAAQDKKSGLRREGAQNVSIFRLSML